MRTDERGPCARVECGHPEWPEHAHGYDGVRTYCAICGSETCPSYKAPGKAPCARCGVPQRVHGSLSAEDLAHAHGIPPGVCPWWVRPAPLWLRTLNRLLGRVGP
jgi:hypothetical protein